MQCFSKASLVHRENEEHLKDLTAQNAAVTPL